ncbi:MAG: hypothetical protein WKG06_10225 [Segetibacter sp.]
MDERKGITIDGVIGQWFAKTGGIKDAKILFFTPPTVPGFGVSSGFTIELQDKTGGSIEKFNKVAGGFLGALNQRPEILYGATGFNPNYPQYKMEVKVAKTKEAGIKDCIFANYQRSTTGYATVCACEKLPVINCNNLK